MDETAKAIAEQLNKVWGHTTEGRHIVVTWLPIECQNWNEPYGFYLAIKGTPPKGELLYRRESDNCDSVIYLGHGQVKFLTRYTGMVSAKKFNQTVMLCRRLYREKLKAMKEAVG